ncbi:hypothetical protein VP01_1185g5 [Puccinia sorghi]|uniref:Uncharacterized protein n=1 Tax=Puccinia sorghi TaxID=27349 RepID=A0A0L6VSF6_9BASI|nr:hypothetical protein VP01_1185g5 [Puccinia sorghi]
MVQRKSNNTVTPSKPLSNSDSDSESEQDSESDSSNSSSESSSSSDTQPEANHSDQEKTFVLHRHLDYGYHHPNNQRNSNSHTGFDLFTARTWKLDEQQIKQFHQLNDTDLVQIHYPVPIKPEPIKKLTLADILPPHNSSSLSNPLPTKSRLPKIPSSPFAGPCVASLYYSAYSSFAPCYDSTASSQTLDQARILSYSKQKIDAWSRRSHRYQHVLINPEPPSTENITPFKKKKSHHAPGIRGRKRQKTSGSTSSSSPAKEPTVPLSPSQVRQEIDATLAETSQLISNLQERQFDRLRHSQDLHHLDPSLSNSSIPPRQHPASHQPVVPEPSRDEILEAHQLVQRLSSVIARRPRPARPIGDQEGPTLEAEQSVIPSAELIRRSYQVLTVGAVGTEVSRDRVVYSGLLPPTNPVGISESTLVTEPSPQLISLLENTQRNTTGPLGTPRAQSNLPLISTPQYNSHSGAASRRDPSLSNARIGSNGPPLMSNGGDYRPSLNGHTLHTNISKLQLLQQQQRQHGPSAAQHHHPALQAEPSIPVRPAPSSSLQSEQQRHLQQLQVQKLLSSSSSSYHALSAHHHPLTTPDIPTSLPVPPIATPSLKPLPASISFLDQNSNNLAHPNHRALASSSSHPTFL